jgi:ABC-2 type transport system ATP-binding protein
MCDRVIILEDGRLGYDGPVNEGIRYVKYDDGKSELDGDEALGDEELGADI